MIWWKVEHRLSLGYSSHLFSRLFSHKQARLVRRLFSMPASVVEHCHAADFIPLFLLVPINCSNKYYDAALIHSFVILRVNLVFQPSKIYFHHQEASQN